MRILLNRVKGKAVSSITMISAQSAGDEFLKGRVGLEFKEISHFPG